MSLDVITLGVLLALGIAAPEQAPLRSRAPRAGRRPGQLRSNTEPARAGKVRLVQAPRRDQERGAKAARGHRRGALHRRTEAERGHLIYFFAAGSLGRVEFYAESGADDSPVAFRILVDGRADK